MAPVKKIANKLTDSEKKKIKQENKAKANPKQAELKAAENMRRRVGRGQEVAEVVPTTPTKTAEELEAEQYDKTKVKNEKPVETDAEKVKRKEAKLKAIHERFANARGIVGECATTACEPSDVKTSALTCEEETSL